MYDTDGSVLARAEQAYAQSVRDPCGRNDLPELLEQARRAGGAGVEALVVALRAQAWCARHSSSGLAAKRYLDEAVRVARRHRLTARLAQVLVTRAAVNSELGHIGAAQRDLDQARAVGASAELDLQQAVLFHNTGRLSAAASLYRRLLDDTGLGPDIRVKVGNNLALIESDQGHPAAALARLERVRPDAESLGPALVAIVEDSRGWVTVQSGRLVRGLQILDHAAEAHRRADLPLGEHYLEHSDALVALRLLPEARAMTARAYADFAERGLELLAAEAQLRVARLALIDADPPAARAAAAAAAERFRRQRRSSWLALARVVEVEARTRLGQAEPSDAATLGRAARLLERAGVVTWAIDAHLAAGRGRALAGRRTVALASLERAGALCSGGPALVRLRGRLAAAESASLVGDRPGVLRHARAGLADLAGHRAALPTAELQALASGHGVELGELALATLLPSGSPAQVLQWLEATRAAAFQPLDQSAPPGSEVDLARLRAVHAELADARRDSGEEPPALLAAQTALESRIRRATWIGGAAGRSRRGTVSLAALRRDLGESTLVEFGGHQGELFAVTLTPRRARLVRLGSRSAVEEQGRTLRFALRRLASGRGTPAVRAAFVASAHAAAGKLREWLVAPLHLQPGDPVVVVPSARIWSLPWAALFDAPVALAPSAAMWARTAARSVPTGGVVLVAGPELPGAAAEIAALAALHPGSRTLVPPDSTVDAVLPALAGADLAHVACHGRLRSDNPTFSSFLLTAGELTVHELQQQPTPRRMVLSACDSSVDTAYASDELVGFVSALLGRGTAGLIGSCIAVPDAAVVPLMVRVHERLLRGDPLALALHRATDGVDVRDPRELAAAYAFSACGAA